MEVITLVDLFKKISIFFCFFVFISKQYINRKAASAACACPE